MAAKATQESLLGTFGGYCAALVGLIGKTSVGVLIGAPIVEVCIRGFDFWKLP